MRVFGYRRRTAQAVNSRRAVRVAFLAHPDSLDAKLIEPLEHNRPLLDFVSRGGGFHHL